MSQQQKRRWGALWDTEKKEINKAENEGKRRKRKKEEKTDRGPRDEEHLRVQREWRCDCEIELMKGGTNKGNEVEEQKGQREQRKRDMGEKRDMFSRGKCEPFFCESE
jgi:hypothetical protein